MTTKPFGVFLNPVKDRFLAQISSGFLAFDPFVLKDLLQLKMNVVRKRQLSFLIHC